MADLIIKLILVGGVFATVMSCVAIMTYVERRVSAFLQERLGPNRVGPYGLLQPMADGIKFLMKEDIIPTRADKAVFILAPAMVLVPALISFAVIPFGADLVLFGKSIKLIIADVNIGILYILAATSLAIYGIFLGAWASNNKYSLIGGLRACAQIISYEIPLGLAIICVLMAAGSLRLGDVVEYQTSGGFWPFLIKFGWNLPALLIFVVASFAETNRLPFDMPECEQELVAGYHTEYSSMKFSMFFMAEYANMITSAAVVTCLFLGGWYFPGLAGLKEFLPNVIYCALTVAVFGAKMACFLFFYVWVRWTLPRFRYDQLMHLGWKGLIPIAFGWFLINGIILALQQPGAGA